MSFIINFFNTILIRLSMLCSALVGLGCLVVTGAKAAMGSGGSVGDRLKNALTTPAAQLHIFAVLRLFAPNIVLKKQFVTAYPNNGTAFVTRFSDVKDVLERDEDFAVVYEPRMRQITSGANFFLGMQDTPEYTRDTSTMRLTMRREDVATKVLPFCTAQANALVEATNGTIDVPQQLSLRVPSLMVGDYFGTPGPSEAELIRWTTLMFWYLFIDLQADPKLGEQALDAARQTCAYLDATIAARKASGEQKDDVLGRCLVLQQAGQPGMDDLGIRNNLIGLMIGAVPTISKACVQALDQLLARPDALAGAQSAARLGNDALLGAYVFEALRFNPVNPVIYRRAVRDTVVGTGTLRQRTVPEGTLVMAGNLSAMFDPQIVHAPSTFRADRPWSNYILWGDALHVCFGAHINAAVIPAILKPLLTKNNLRRAAGSAGQIDTGNTPFPQHFHVEWN